MTNLNDFCTYNEFLRDSKIVAGWGFYVVGKFLWSKKVVGVKDF